MYANQLPPDFVGHRQIVASLSFQFVLSSVSRLRYRFERIERNGTRRSGARRGLSESARRFANVATQFDRWSWELKWSQWRSIAFHQVRFFRRHQFTECIHFRCYDFRFSVRFAVQHCNTCCRSNRSLVVLALNWNLRTDFAIKSRWLRRKWLSWWCACNLLSCDCIQIVFF